MYTLALVLVMMVTLVGDRVRCLSLTRSLASKRAGRQCGGGIENCFHATKTTT